MRMVLAEAGCPYVSRKETRNATRRPFLFKNRGKKHTIRKRLKGVSNYFNAKEICKSTVPSLQKPMLPMQKVHSWLSSSGATMYDYENNKVLEDDESNMLCNAEIEEEPVFVVPNISESDKAVVSHCSFAALVKDSSGKSLSQDAPRRLSKDLENNLKLASLEGKEFKKLFKSKEKKNQREARRELRKLNKKSTERDHHLLTSIKVQNSLIKSNKVKCCHKSYRMTSSSKAWKSKELPSQVPMVIRVKRRLQTVKASIPGLTHLMAGNHTFAPCSANWKLTSTNTSDNKTCQHEELKSPSSSSSLDKLNENYKMHVKNTNSSGPAILEELDHSEEFNEVENKQIINTESEHNSYCDNGSPDCDTVWTSSSSEENESHGNIHASNQVFFGNAEGISLVHLKMSHPANEEEDTSKDTKNDSDTVSLIQNLKTVFCQFILKLVNHIDLKVSACLKLLKLSKWKKKILLGSINSQSISDHVEALISICHDKVYIVMETLDALDKQQVLLLNQEEQRRIWLLHDTIVCSLQAYKFLQKETPLEVLHNKLWSLLMLSGKTLVSHCELNVNGIISKMTKICGIQKILAEKNTLLPVCQCRDIFFLLNQNMLCRECDVNNLYTDLQERLEEPSTITRQCLPETCHLEACCVIDQLLPKVSWFLDSLQKMNHQQLSVKLQNHMKYKFSCNPDAGFYPCEAHYSIPFCSCFYDQNSRNIAKQVSTFPTESECLKSLVQSKCNQQNLQEKLTSELSECNVQYVQGNSTCSEPTKINFVESCSFLQPESNPSSVRNIAELTRNNVSCPNIMSSNCSPPIEGAQTSFSSEDLFAVDLKLSKISSKNENFVLNSDDFKGDLSDSDMSKSTIEIENNDEVNDQEFSKFPIEMSDSGNVKDREPLCSVDSDKPLRENGMQTTESYVENTPGQDSARCSERSGTWNGEEQQPSTSPLFNNTKSISSLHNCEQEKNLCKSNKSNFLNRDIKKKTVSFRDPMVEAYYEYEHVEEESFSSDSLDHVSKAKCQEKSTFQQSESHINKVVEGEMRQGHSESKKDETEGGLSEIGCPEMESLSCKNNLALPKKSECDFSLSLEKQNISSQHAAENQIGGRDLIEKKTDLKTVNDETDTLLKKSAENSQEEQTEKDQHDESICKIGNRLSLNKNRLDSLKQSKKKLLSTNKIVEDNRKIKYKVLFKGNNSIKNDGKPLSDDKNIACKKSICASKQRASIKQIADTQANTPSMSSQNIGNKRRIEESPKSAPNPDHGMETSKLAALVVKEESEGQSFEEIASADESWEFNFQTKRSKNSKGNIKQNSEDNEWDNYLASLQKRLVKIKKRKGF